MSSTDIPPALALALSDIMHHMSPSPAPTSDDQGASASTLPAAGVALPVLGREQDGSYAHQEVDVFGIRRRLEELGYSVAASRNGVLGANVNARERELVDMVIRLTDSLPVDPAQLERQAETIASLAAQRDFIMRQAEEERERWISEKEGWERTAEALLTFRNKQGKSEDVDRLKASFEAENKALRDKLQEAQRRLSTLEGELLRLKPMLLMQPFPPSSSSSSSTSLSTSRQDKGKGRELDSSSSSSRTLLGLGTIPEDRETHAQGGGGKTQYYFHNYQHQSQQGQGRMTLTGTTGGQHQRRRSRDLTTAPSSIGTSTSKPPSQSQSTSRHQKGQTQAPPQPLTSDAYTEHILLAAKKIGRKRAAQVAGLEKMVEREREVLGREQAAYQQQQQQERVRVVGGQTQREQQLERERENGVGGGYYRTGLDGNVVPIPMGSPQRGGGTTPRATGSSSAQLPRTPKRNAAASSGIHYSNLGTATPTNPLSAPSASTPQSHAHNQAHNAKHNLTAMQVDSPLVYVNVTPSSAKNKNKTQKNGGSASLWASGSGVGVMGTPGQLRSALGGRAGGGGGASSSAAATPGGQKSASGGVAVTSNPPTPLASLLDAALMMDHEEGRAAASGASGTGTGTGTPPTTTGTRANANAQGTGKTRGGGGKANGKGRAMLDEPPESPPAPKRRRISGSASGAAGKRMGSDHANSGSGGGNTGGGGNGNLNRVRSALDVLADQAAAAFVDHSQPQPHPLAAAVSTSATSIMSTSSSTVKGKGKAKAGRNQPAGGGGGGSGTRGGGAHAQGNEGEEEPVSTSRAGRVVRGGARGSTTSASASGAGATRDTTASTTATSTTSSRPVRQAASKRRLLSPAPELGDKESKTQGRNRPRARPRASGGNTVAGIAAAGDGGGKGGDALASTSLAGAAGHVRAASTQPQPQPRVIAPAPGYSVSAHSPPSHSLPPSHQSSGSNTISGLEGRSEKDMGVDVGADAGVSQQTERSGLRQEQRRAQELQQPQQEQQGRGRPVTEDQDKPMHAFEAGPVAERGESGPSGRRGDSGERAASSASPPDVVMADSTSSARDLDDTAGHRQRPVPAPPPSHSLSSSTQESNSEPEPQYIDAESYRLAAAAGALNGQGRPTTPVVVFQGSGSVVHGVPFSTTVVQSLAPSSITAAAVGGTVSSVGAQEEEDDGLLDADADAEPDPDLDADADAEGDQDEEQEQEHATSASRSKSPPPDSPPPPPPGPGGNGGSGSGSGGGGGNGGGGTGGGGGQFPPPGGGGEGDEHDEDADADADAEADPDPDAEGEMEFEEGEGGAALFESPTSLSMPSEAAIATHGSSSHSNVKLPSLSDLMPPASSSNYWGQRTSSGFILAGDIYCLSSGNSSSFSDTMLQVQISPESSINTTCEATLTSGGDGDHGAKGEMDVEEADGGDRLSGSALGYDSRLIAFQGPLSCQEQSPMVMPSSPRSSFPDAELEQIKDDSAVSATNPALWSRSGATPALSSHATSCGTSFPTGPSSYYNIHSSFLPYNLTLQALAELSPESALKLVSPSEKDREHEVHAEDNMEVEDSSTSSELAIISDSRSVRRSSPGQSSSRHPQSTHEPPSSSSTLSSHPMASGSSHSTKGPSHSTIASSSLSDPTLQVVISPDSPNTSTSEAVSSSQLLSLSTKLGLLAQSAQNSFSLSPANMPSSSFSDSVPLLKFHTESSSDCLSIPFMQCVLSHDRHLLEKFKEHHLSLSDSRLVEHGSKRHRSKRGFQRNISQLPVLKILPVSDKWSNDDENLGQHWKEFGFPSLSGLDIIWPPKLKGPTSSWSSLYRDVNLAGPPFRTASSFVHPLVEAMN